MKERVMGALEGVAVRTKGSVGRCAFCHDGVDVGARLACAACLAVHHPECWTELRRCASCGARQDLHAGAWTPPVPRRDEMGDIFFDTTLLAAVVLATVPVLGLDFSGPTPAPGAVVPSLACALLAGGAASASRPVSLLFYGALGFLTSLALDRGSGATACATVVLAASVAGTAKRLWRGAEVDPA